MDFEARSANARWMRVARSDEPDSRSAGWAAADEVLGSDRAALLEAFVSEAHDLEALAGAIAQRSDGGAAIGSDAPLGIGVRHGWRRVGQPMLVSESAGNRVYALDERPALDAYLERLDAPQAAWHDPAAFTAFALTHPLGLDRRGEAQARFIGEADFDERSLGCIAEVPQGALAWSMEGDERSVLDATDAACRAALAQLDGSAPLGLIAFDCIARRGVLGEPGITREVEQIAQLPPASPLPLRRATNDLQDEALVVRKDH